ncbi:MAG: peptidoglycan-binding protein, partial [bacterium]
AAPPLETEGPEEGVAFVRIETSHATDGATEVPTFEPMDTPTEAPIETPTAVPTEAPTAEPPTGLTAAEALGQVDTTAQSQSSGFEYLPVYSKVDTFERKIAITVDDCFQVGNLQTIANSAVKNGGKLTLFPIGENLTKNGMVETLRTCAFDLGFEIENHTMSHERVFKLSEYDMARQIWDQRQAVNLALGANYEQHFFRLMGGDGSSDQRTHNYLKQLGFYGIADWSISGSNADLQELKNYLQPGAIFLFHTTDRDTKILTQFIPYCASMGYEMVTLNELLGFEENAVYPYRPEEMILPQPYEEDYRTHKVGDYAYNILLMQDKLRALGLLEMDGASTGYFGKKTAEAVQAFQAKMGLPATGVADAATQRLLMAA